MVLTVTCRKKTIQSSTYKAGEQSISCAPQYEYLGVTICQDLEWDNPISDIIVTKKQCFLRKVLKK